jgi:hypothetical protein
MKRLVILLPVLLAFQVGVQPAFAWTWPVDGPVLRPFDLGDDPYAGGQHRGIDIGAPQGAAVIAPAGGRVTFAGSVPTGGRAVAIRTADGYSVTLVQLGTLGVAEGSAVAEGDLVGTIGPSNEAEVSEPHVHLGIRIASDPNGYLDPLAFLPPRPSGSETPADPARAPAPVFGAKHTNEKAGPAASRPSRVTSQVGAEGVARASRGRLGRTIRVPAHVPVPVRRPLSSSFERRVGSRQVAAAPRPAEDRGFAFWPLIGVAAAVGPALAVLCRKLRDAGPANRAPAVLLERLVTPAEDADGLWLRQEDRLVLDRDLERILFAEAKALPDLDRDHDPAELVYVADDPRPGHSSRRACRRGDCLPRGQRVLPSRPSLIVSL